MSNIARVKISLHSLSDTTQDCYLPSCSIGNGNTRAGRKAASDMASRRWAGRRSHCDLCSFPSTLLLPMRKGRGSPRP